MESQTMDRGGNSALEAHLSDVRQMEIRQTRRGWCQEILGCEAKTEFKYFIGDQQIAHSLEDTDCCCRIFFSAIHPFVMVVKEVNTDAEMLSLDRPLRCAAGPCKCCCYQEATISSSGKVIGTLKETCYFCVISTVYSDANDKAIYKIHPPTCCGGCCVNCCTEGGGLNICCKVPFHIFPADMDNTNGAEPLGKIVKKPKSLMTEVFTDANAFDVHFPAQASIEEKAALIGTSIMLNAMFFEENN